MKRGIFIILLSISIISLAVIANSGFDDKPSVNQINLAISHGHCNLLVTAELESASYVFTDKNMDDLKIHFSVSTNSIIASGDKNGEYTNKLRSDVMFGQSKTIDFQCVDNFRLGEDWFQIRGNLSMSGKTNPERFRATRIYDNNGILMKFLIEGRIDLSNYDIESSSVDNLSIPEGSGIMFLNFTIEA